MSTSHVLLPKPVTVEPTTSRYGVGIPTKCNYRVSKTIQFNIIYTFKIRARLRCLPSFPIKLRFPTDFLVQVSSASYRTFVGKPGTFSICSTKGPSHWVFISFRKGVNCATNFKSWKTYISAELHNGTSTRYHLRRVHWRGGLLWRWGSGNDMRTGGLMITL